MGILHVVQALAGGANEPLYIAVNLIFAFFFGLGIVAGAALLEDTPRSIRLSLIYQAIQIPVLTSPFVHYSFSSAFFIAMYYGQNGFEHFLELGSHSMLLLNGEAAWNLGVNFAAISFFICLFVVGYKKPRWPDIHTEAVKNSTIHSSPVHTRRNRELASAQSSPQHN